MKVCDLSGGENEVLTVVIMEAIMIRASPLLDKIPATLASLALLSPTRV